MKEATAAMAACLALRGEMTAQDTRKQVTLEQFRQKNAATAGGGGPWRLISGPRSKGGGDLGPESLDTAGDEPFIFQTCGFFIAVVRDLAPAMWQFKDRTQPLRLQIGNMRVSSIYSSFLAGRKWPGAPNPLAPRCFEGRFS